MILIRFLSISSSRLRSQAKHKMADIDYRAPTDKSVLHLPPCRFIPTKTYEENQISTLKAKQTF